MDNTMISAQYISERVQQALAEDVGAGDITASLIAPDALASADVITREAGILCGKAFADETFRRVDPRCSTVWLVADGDPLDAGDTLFRVTGPARALLTAERTALNFLQALSGTATVAKDYADRVAHTDVRLLDTRKTVP
jgi:nicotinate-nucleotide pyrophosphorylase (carboxylating)